MKLNFKSLALIAVAGLTVSAGGLKAATVNYTLGDLVMGFTASSGQGSTSVYLVDLGSATSFRDATSSISSIRDLSTDLSNIFGSTWYERTDLSFGIAAVLNSSPTAGGAVNGDPKRTIYASVARPDVADQSIAWGSGTPLNSSTRGTVSGNVVSLENLFAAATATGNAGGYAAEMIANDPTGKSWQQQNSASDSFTGLTGGIQQSFASGSYGDFGFGNVEGALDLYRILNTNTGANPTGTVGVGSYEGTFTIDSSGIVSFIAPVPEPSTYAMLVAGISLLAFVKFRKRQNAIKA